LGREGVRRGVDHCGVAHLNRYLAEFDFRFNRRTALKWTNAERHADLLSRIEGKRLTCRRFGEASYAYTVGGAPFTEEQKSTQSMIGFGLEKQSSVQKTP